MGGGYCADEKANFELECPFVVFTKTIMLKILVNRKLISSGY